MSDAASHTVTVFSYQERHAIMVVIVTGGFAQSAASECQYYIVQACMCADIA